jgi:hypothetical protein
MSCPELHYANVSADAWQCCKRAVSQYVKIDKDEGEETADGFTIKWKYDAGQKSLMLQCTGKPFIVSCGYVNERIDSTVRGCLRA